MERHWPAQYTPRPQRRRPKVSDLNLWRVQLSTLEPALVAAGRPGLCTSTRVKGAGNAPLSFALLEHIAGRFFFAQLWCGDSDLKSIFDDSLEVSMLRQQGFIVAAWRSKGRDLGVTITGGEHAHSWPSDALQSPRKLLLVGAWEHPFSMALRPAVRIRRLQIRPLPQNLVAMLSKQDYLAEIPIADFAARWDSHTVFARGERAILPATPQLRRVNFAREFTLKSSSATVSASSKE